MDWINFAWGNSIFSGREFDKTFMSISIDLSLSHTKEVMQFDLGLAKTIFYHSAISRLVLESKIKVIPSKTEINGQKTAYILNNVSLKIGRHKFTKDQFLLLYDSPIDSSQVDHDSDFVSIGSIGTDFCAEKVLIIDYPNHRIAVLDSVPKTYRKLHFTKFRQEGHLILLPFLINNKSEYLIFDTGSSMFSLIVDKVGWNKIPKNKKSRKFKISVWGKIYTVYENSSFVDISFAGIDLQQYPVYYSSYLNTDSGFLKSIGALGMVGNKYFLDKKVILDFQTLNIAVVG